MRKKRKRILITIILLAFITLIALFILNKDKIYSLFDKKVETTVSNEEKLKLLNYNDNTITLFKENSIDNYIIKKNKYSKTLEVAISDTNYKKDNIDNYLNIEYLDAINFIYNINSLIEIGYNDDEINTLFKTLNNNSIEVLIKDNCKDILDYLKIDYFNEDYIDRYIKYKKIKSDSSYDDIILFVNMGLDNEFYTAVNNITNQDDILVLVNKYNKLSSDFVPKNLKTVSSRYSTKTVQLVDVAKTKFEEMCADAEAVNITIKAGSTYRSYSYQNTLYNNYVNKDGKKEADTYSARPGYSEHQTGLAIDVKDKKSGFIEENTDEYTWLINNSYKYGFILRYPKGKEYITGYIFEPWHYRYLGVDVATYIHDNNVTYEEYIAKKVTK